MLFSGVVVTYNEAHLLRRCLESIDFCAEIIVVDLGSTDESRQIASEFGARILDHAHVPYANLPRQFGMAHVTHEWVISIDPDEVFPKSGVPVIESILTEQPTLAAIEIPWQFYFRGQKLKCTIWGRPGAAKTVILHRDRLIGTPFVHREFRINDNVRSLSRDQIEPLQHFWMRSYRELIERHRRYAQNEGRAMAAEGRRFTWRSLAVETARAVKQNLFDWRGWRGGFTGLFLSFFYAWYVAMNWLSLRRYQRQHDGAERGGP